MNGYHLRKENKLEGIELARRIVDLISDVKGENIVLIDLRHLTPITDYFVICSAGNERQLNAIVEKITSELKHGDRGLPYRVEGQAAGGWILVDYGEVVVHAFSPQQRDYYKLEEFWQEGKTLLRIQ